MRVGRGERIRAQTVRELGGTEVMGSFSEEEVPNRWRTFVLPTKVTFSYANGMVMLIR